MIHWGKALPYKEKIKIKNLPKSNNSSLKFQVPPQELFL